MARQDKGKSTDIFKSGRGGHSGRTLASHLWGRGSVPGTASSGKAGSCFQHCTGHIMTGSWKGQRKPVHTVRQGSVL